MTRTAVKTIPNIDVESIFTECESLGKEKCQSFNFNEKTKTLYILDRKVSDPGV